MGHQGGLMKVIKVIFAFVSILNSVSAVADTYSCTVGYYSDVTGSAPIKTLSTAAMTAADCVDNLAMNHAVTKRQTDFPGCTLNGYNTANLLFIKTTSSTYLCTKYYWDGTNWIAKTTTCTKTSTASSSKSIRVSCGRAVGWREVGSVSNGDYCAAGLRPYNVGYNTSRSNYFQLPDGFFSCYADFEPTHNCGSIQGYPYIFRRTDAVVGTVTYRFGCGY